MSTESSSVKKVLILGANGVGKSWILNRLLKKNKLFPSGSGGPPVTKEIKQGDASFEIKNRNFHLCAFDTPGIVCAKLL
jgi:ribosome biogenesis GTPase A